MKISDLFEKYRSKIDLLDLELIIAHALKKPREFVLAHPERKLTVSQKVRIERMVARRGKNEPLAYILDHKEFFGLDFKVTKDTLIPRPETELLVEMVLKLVPKNNIVIDIGTGSGNIIISLAKYLKGKNYFYATDISPRTLAVARQNSKNNHLEGKISFLHGSLLDPLFKSKNQKLQTRNLLIVANLPYLSKEIYSATAPDVKNYEPKSALVSGTNGLDHYKKLLEQIKLLATNHELRTTNYLEISPEQKPLLQKLAKAGLPEAEITFYRDLAGKWRICRISI